MSRALFCTIYLVFCCNLVSGQHRFERYTTEQGLSQNSILSMLQDKRGFLWIGTEDGLNRFDGYTFKKFYHHAGDTSGLTDDQVWTLLEDKNGIIWIGHIKGLTTFDPRTQVFKNVLFEEGLYVLSASELGNGELWFGSGGHGLIKVDQGKVSRFKNNTPVPAPHDAQAWYFTANNFPVIHSYKDGLLVGSRGAGIFYFSRNEFHRLETPVQWDDFFKLNDIWSFLVHNDSIYIASGQGLGVFDLNFSTGRILKASGRENDLTFSRIADLAIQQDNLWVATYGGGLNCLDLKTQKITAYQYQPHNSHGISSNLVFKLLVDDQGNLWAGTWARGLNKLSTNAQAIHVYNVINEIENPVIMGVLQTDVYLYVATHKGIVYKTEIDALQSNSVKFKEIFRTWYINDIEKGKENFWLALDGGGIGYAQNENEPIKTLKRIPGNRYSLNNHLVTDVLETSPVLWVGTRGSGLNRIQLDIPYGAPGSVSSFKHEVENIHSLSGNLINILYYDSKGFLWVGTENGLNRSYNPAMESDSLTFLRLAPHRTTALLETEDNFWVGTDVGLFTIKEDGDLTPVSQLEGHFINSILQDGDGFLWVSTNNGIFLIRDKAVQFTVRDGLPTNEFNIRSSWRGSNGRLFFGSTDGLVSIAPEGIRANKTVAPIWVTRAVVNRKQEIEFPTKIELSHEHRIIDFEFSFLDYTNSLSNQYAYQLEGFDEQWIYTSSEKRLVTYTNLDAGNYVFKVKASNGFGQWSEEVYPVFISVSPPIWKTVWAYGLYTIFLIGILLAVRKTIVNRERLKSNLRLEHMALQKLQELDDFKSKFFTNISHEFRTPLTLILGQLDALKEELSNPQPLESIRHNSFVLLQLVNQLLDLSRIDAGKLELRIFSVGIREFLKMHIEAFQSMAFQKQIQLTIEYPDIAEINIDPDVLEKIINNLLSNAIKYTPIGGKVCCSASYVKGVFLLSVENTGTGISPEKQKFIFDRFYRASDMEQGTGIGLALTQELVRLHGGEIEVNSQEGLKTEFIVKIPVTSGEYPEFSHITTQSVISEYKPKQVSSIIDTNHTAEKSVALIVEDNEELRNFMACALMNSYQVLVAENGLVGLEQALNAIPDIVVTDWMMPEMSGTELCKKIKSVEATSHIPVILLTARTGQGDRLEGFDVGADDYITKPFDMAELLARIQNLVQQRRFLREKFSNEGLFHYKHIKVSSLDEDFMKRLQAVLEECYSDSQLSVDGLSRKMGVSRVQLHRKLTALTGYSPGDLLREFRLQRAADLLRQKAGNVSEIAFQVGFENLSYFTKVFKQKFQVTPSEFTHQ